MVWQPPHTALVTVKPRNLIIRTHDGVDGGDGADADDINCDGDDAEDGCDKDLET